ncbi:glycosyltransferase family 2 protein [Casimicrobium huifangae]|uniref:glycosyltransferase family 2 protein n=1 Tax=Casimicrobium huifangae TaxID=2591109 RepID=UPI0012EC6558|nr:glycosyltransferase family 2 protein [Casimicrobium huifangae]
MNCQEERTLFTVVIPLYNKAKYIYRCLDSVANQKYHASEVIVINDGSTDDGPNLVLRYSKLPIRLIQQNNAGVSAARNAGIAAAQHKWIAFLDADDEYLPDFLDRVAKAIQLRPEAGLIYGWSYFSDGTTKTFPSSTDVMPKRVEDYFKYVVSSKGKEVNTSCVAVRRDIFVQAGNFPLGVAVGEDSDMWMRAAWVTTFVVIPTWLSIYHTDASGSGWERQVLCDAYWLNTYRDWKQSYRIPVRLMATTDLYVQHYYLSRALYLAVRDKRANALNVLLRQVNYFQAPGLFAAKVFFYTLLPIGKIRMILGRKKT